MVYYFIAILFLKSGLNVYLLNIGLPNTIDKQQFSNDVMFMSAFGKY
jgi:hypothetical protein